MGILDDITSKIVDCSWDFLVARLKYLIKCKDNIQELDVKVKMLETARERLKHEVEEALRNADEIEFDVQNWLDHVGKIVEEANVFLESERKRKKNCSFNLVSRYQLSKKAKEMAMEVHENEERSKIFPRVFYRKSPQENMTTSIKGYEFFESRKQNMNDVIKAMVDPDINMIGVHGMPGVGKTTLARKVREQAMNDKLFDEVIMVAVGQIQDFQNIQAQIGDVLDLKFNDKESLEGRAIKLHKRLDGKKILLILDDIWDELDLEKVGIPSTGQQNGVKVLITSRYEHVLSNKMSTEKNIEIGLLTEDESWRFFNKIVGKAMTKAPYMEHIGRYVVRECARLPIALAIVAKMLKNKEEAIWRYALEVLRNPAEEELHEVNKEVYHSIKLSYDFLQTEAQSLLLLCSVFPEDYDIDVEELFMYSKGMGLLLSRGTLARGRDKVVKLVDDLKSSCLLLESENDSRIVKMHDVVRDVAISIASKEKGMHLLSYGHGVREWPDKDTCGSYTAIFLGCKNFGWELPKKLELPNLEILLLRKPFFNIDVSDTFLKGMEKLKVLHLEKMCISSRTKSFTSLKNLRTLGLQDCKLKDVGILRELKNLEILSFKGSGIKELSSGLSQLIQLKMLDLTDCSELKVIPPNLISSFSDLEELYMENSFTGWEGVGTNNERKNASLYELKHLPLTVLYICIPDANILPKYLFSGNLSKYRIVIGREWSLSKSTNGAQRALEVKANSSMFSEDGAKFLVKKSEELWLTEIVALETILVVLGRCTSLRKLYIEDCQVAINRVVTPSPRERLQPLFDEKVTLPNLETLEILKTNKLEILWHKRQLPNSFVGLREVKIIGCNYLKRVFPSSTSTVLQNLEVLVVKKCELLEEITDPFGAKEKAGDVITSKLKCLDLEDLPILKNVLSKEEGLETTTIQFVFPKLTYLGLKDLPCLEAFYVGIHTSELPSLDELVVASCGKLTIFDSEISRVLSSGKEYLDIQNDLPLFLMKKVAFSGLRHLTVSCDVIIKDLAHGRFSKEWFPDLRVFKLEGSSNDYNPITTHPSTIFKRIPTIIESLEVRSAFFEDIWTLEELNIIGDQDNRTEIFPQLEALSLYDLPKLVYLWKNNSHKMTMFQKIASLHVEKCGLLDVLVPTSGSFQNLQFLTIKECNELTYLLSSSTAKSLVKLQVLRVSKCEKVNTLVCSGEEENNIAWISQLQGIYLDNLPNLTSLHSEDSNVQFTSLHQINVDECNELTYLFSSSAAKSLVNLEFINISGCKNIKTLVSAKEDEIVPILQFQVMNMTNLPNRTHLENCKFEYMNLVDSPNLTSLHLENCKCEVMNLTISPNLISLHLENCKCKVMNLTDLPNLTGMHLENCQCQCMNLIDLPNLRSLHLENYQSQYMNLTDLPNLTNLYLENSLCEVMNLDNLPNFTSLHLGNYQCQIMNLSNLPNLTSLHLENYQCQIMNLSNLPNLTSLHPENNTLQFTVTQAINLVDCPKIKKFPPGISCVINSELTENQEN